MAFKIIGVDGFTEEENRVKVRGPTPQHQLSVMGKMKKK